MLLESRGNVGVGVGVGRNGRWRAASLHVRGNSRKEAETGKCNHGTESAVPFHVESGCISTYDATPAATNFLIWPDKNRPQTT